MHWPDRSIRSLRRAYRAAVLVFPGRFDVVAKLQRFAGGAHLHDFAGKLGMDVRHALLIEIGPAAEGKGAGDVGDLHVVCFNGGDLDRFGAGGDRVAVDLVRAGIFGVALLRVRCSRKPGVPPEKRRRPLSRS